MWSVFRQEVETGIGVVDDAGERLSDFMGYGSGQFTHGRQACHMSEFRLSLAQSLFGLLALNSNTRQMGALVNQVPVLRAGAARFAVEACKGSTYFALC